METLEDVKGKKILITGGSTGIGKETAKTLVRKGAKVIIFSRSQEKVDKALEEIKKEGEIYGLAADVTKTDDLKRVFQLVDEKFSQLDVLINNAGIGGEGLEMESEKIEYLIADNLTGYILCAKMAAERMPNGGNIINIGSLSAKTKDPESTVYVAAKSGVKGFTEALRKEVFDKDIKVTLIEPGSVATPLHGISDNELEEYLQRDEMLSAHDIAIVIYFCLIQPKRSDIIHLEIKPQKQNI